MNTISTYVLIATLLTPIWFFPVRIILLIRSKNYTTFFWFYVVAFVWSVAGVAYYWSIKAPSGIAYGFVLLIGWLFMSAGMIMDLSNKSFGLTKKVTTHVFNFRYTRISLFVAFTSVICGTLAGMFSNSRNLIHTLFSFIHHFLFSPAQFIWLRFIIFRVLLFHAIAFATWFVFTYVVCILVWFVRRNYLLDGIKKSNR